MKKLIIAVAAVLVTAASYGQATPVGEIFFATRNTGIGLNAPVFLVPDGTKGPGTTYSAQLGLFANGTFTPIASSLTTFQAPGAGGAAILDRYVAPVTAQVGSQGQAVTVRMRAWETSRGSFDAAKTAGIGFGESGDINLTLGGGTLPPADLPSSFTGFNVTAIPEPSTIALGILGAAALLIRRRK
jgi:hypothetical protein